MAAPEGIGLADLITRTTNEIRKAREAAPKDDPVLLLSGCELTLAVTVSAEGSASLKIYLVDLSGKAKGERVSTIKLTFGAATGPDGKLQAFEAANALLPGQSEPPIKSGTRATKAEGPGNS